MTLFETTPPQPAVPLESCELDDASLARTSTDCARAAVLTSWPRHGRPVVTCVGLNPDANGDLIVFLAPSSPAVTDLRRRPLVTLRLAPAACEPVTVHGTARLDTHKMRDGLAVFRVEVVAVRVGVSSRRVDKDQYSSAIPDPLRVDAPHVLARLNGAHGTALAASLRSRGLAVGFATATRLDRYGLSVLIVNDTGVDTVRIGFAAPVTELAGLGRVLRAALQPSQSGIPDPPA